MSYRTSWNLSLLYKGKDDPQIEKDLKRIERTCASFEGKYKNVAFTARPTVLAEALADREALSEAIDGRKPWWYFALQADLNSDDSATSAMATKLEQRIAAALNRVTFFDLEVAKIASTDQSKFLKHKALAPYRYALERVFQSARYNLTEGEEQLENLLSQTSYSMWIEAQERLLNQQIVKHGTKKLPIVQAISELSDLPKGPRRKLHGEIIKNLKSISHVAEAELNAVYNFKKVMDERRGFEKPYSATILGYENDERSIERFVALVTKRFPIAHRFYKLHAKLHGERAAYLADRASTIGAITTTFDFETSVEILRAVLARVDQDYVAILDRFLANGQIDVLPRKGKRGGAYCWGMGQLPTFVLLNHVNDVRSLETLAHEMGHAIHTELSRAQPPRYRKYSTATAEVASTFFEQLIADEIERRLPKNEQKILLHNRLMGDVSTIFRQIACFNFEYELHVAIRSEGQVSKEVMAGLMAKHLRSYLGKTIRVTEDDGYYFIYWSHIRRFFYVYTYAYGQLISRALYERWKKDPSYAIQIKQFLQAGRSMSPEAIFASIGIDTAKTSFFEAGLTSIEQDIERLEQMA